MTPTHIAVEGPVGVGKTVLARRLAQHRRAPLTSAEKQRCYVALARWLGDRHHNGRRIAAMLLRELTRAPWRKAAAIRP